MKETVVRELESIEREKGVRVLLSVESGSRAWGIASEDSDYDVRFVYVRPVRDYLRLEKMRDTIEWKLDEVLDISGWDLMKFLRLVRGSNPTAFEWLGSPIVYAESDNFAQVRKVVKGCFSPKASAFHYLGISGERNRGSLQDETTSAKRYLYTIRALLAAQWCLDEQSPAPMLVKDLFRAKLPSDLLPSVECLLEAKTSGKERLEVVRDAALDEWIVQKDQELYARAKAEVAPKSMPWEVLDELFLQVLEDCFGSTW